MVARKKPTPLFEVVPGCEEEGEACCVEWARGWFCRCSFGSQADGVALERAGRPLSDVFMPGRGIPNLPGDHCLHSVDAAVVAQEDGRVEHVADGGFGWV